MVPFNLRSTMSLNFFKWFISLHSIEMNIEKQVRSLCTPAKIYFLISTIGILGMLVQNYGGGNIYTIGTQSVSLPHKSIIYFVFKALYELGWTYRMQSLCNNGYKKLSWFLVLLPFLFMFVAIGMIFVVFRKH